MSLDWNLTQIKNYQKVCRKENGDLAVVTHALIYTMMGIGICSITEKNAAEVYARVAMYEKLHGAQRTAFNSQGGVDKIYFTTKDIRDHIGLRTNASTVPLAKWCKGKTEWFIRDEIQLYERMLEKESEQSQAETAKA